MFKTISIAFLVRALGALSAFVMNVVIARQLPIEEAGYFLLMFTIISILVPINQVGSSIASLRFIGSLYSPACSESDWLEIQKIANSTRLIVLVCSIFTALCTWYLAPLIANELWHKSAMLPVLRSSCIIVILMSLSMLAGHHLQAINRTAASIAILSIFIPLGVSLLCLSSNIENALEAMTTLQIAAIANLIFASVLWVYFSSKNNLQKAVMKPLLKTCFPLWIITAAAIITSFGSQFVAVIWIDSEDIAKFAVAQRTALLVSFILIAVNMVTAPMFAALYHNEKLDEFKNLAFKTTQLMVIISVPTSLLIIYFAENIMSLFGNEFREAGYLLIILAVGQLVNVATGSVAQILNMSGHEREMRNVVLISCPITIVLALILTPLFGVIGAAIATTVGVSLQNIGAVYKVQVIFGFNILMFWKKGN